jgi:hypothetical protein
MMLDTVFLLLIVQRCTSPSVLLGRRLRVEVPSTRSEKVRRTPVERRTNSTSANLGRIKLNQILGFVELIESGLNRTEG